MSRFAQTYEDPSYEYVSTDEWDQVFPSSGYTDSELENMEKTSGIRVNKSTTFVLHKNNEELSPFSTINS